MWTSPAFAQAAGGAPGGFDIMTLLPLVLIFVVFYFLLIRPQQKKVKDHKTLISALRRGDRVLTSGGIIATVTKVVNDNELQVEISDGVRVRLAKSAVSEVLAKTEPSAREGAAEAPDEAKGKESK